MSKTKFSKVLALVIMLVLVIGILPMGAMASTTPVYVRFFNDDAQIGTTVSVTASDNTAYSAITAAISSLGSSVITSSDINANGINSINGLTPSETTTDNDAWLYTVNDRLAQERISDMPVSAGDVVTVFYASDYTKTYFAYIVPDGAATIGNAIAAGSSDTFYYRVATSTVDFNNLYSVIGSASQSDSGVSTVTASPTISGCKVIPAYKRVIGTESGTLAAWKAETLAAYNALTSDQQTPLSTLYNAARSSSATMSDVNALADAVAPLTRANSAELKRLVFTQSSDYLNITQTATGKDGFDPDVTSYRLQVVNGSINVSATTLTDSTNATVTYSSSGTGMTVSSAGAITFSAAGTYTLTVTVSNEIETDNTVTKSYTVTIPYTAAATSNVPKTVCGYLPVGQFARPNSMGWGTIYTDNTNVYASNKTPKFTAGYVSTGVSLGVLGGYVQFEFEDAIGNDADNPYGIDFIVYGNAFNGNPEAGAVMVYGKNTATNTPGWYNLAGSRHYTSGTTKNENITYIKITTANTSLNSAFTAAGIYYSKNFTKPASDTQALVDAQVGAATWTSITTATGWWPEIGNNENYEQVWKMHRPDTTTVGQTGIDSDVGGVYWYTNGTALVIRYEGVTEVFDSNTTDDYYFGYADVRPNGTNYGVAVNPYATAPSAANGGDGFDLSWAVDVNGLPVNLTDVKIVRVYSAVLFNAGVFGETSTEVNGIYVANKANSNVGITSAPTSVKLYKPNDADGHSVPSIPNNGGSVLDINQIRKYAQNAGELTVRVEATSGSNVFVNDVKLTESSTGIFTGTIPTPAVGGKLRVLVQHGNKEPYLFIIK